MSTNVLDADLRGADLRGAVLSYTFYDHRTGWPHGFHPQQHGTEFVVMP